MHFMEETAGTAETLGEIYQHCVPDPYLLKQYLLKKITLLIMQ